MLTTELLHATLPTQIRALGQVWLYPSVVIGLLVVLIIGDPGRIDKPKPWLRVVTGLLISFIAVVNAACTIYLVDLILTTHARWARRTDCSAPEPPCGSSTLLEFG